VLFATPVAVGGFLVVNGAILLGGERSDGWPRFGQ
jgi:hypothetical protein